MAAAAEVLFLGTEGLLRTHRYTPCTVKPEAGGAEREAGSVRTSEPDESEQRLVAAIAAGDPSALGDLYDRSAPGIYGLALHLLGDRVAAEDVVQETLVKLWRQPDLYQPSRGRLLPWLLTIAHHHAVDLLRRRKIELRHQATTSFRDGRLSADGVTAADRSPEADPENMANASEQRSVLVNALADLPVEQRAVLELAYFQGLTQSEVARTLGEPLGTVKTRMRLGLQRLRQASSLIELWKAS